MKFKINYSVVLIAIISLSLFSSCNRSKKNKWPDTIKIASFNIEYDNKNNPENPWEDRQVLVEKTFDKYNFDIVGVQEPFISQLNDMSQLLPNYGYVGTTVKGSTTMDRQLTVGISYKKDRFSIEKWDKFWLSETPDVPSKGWDSEQYRICTWALVKDRETNQKFYFFSTHLSFAGLEGRNQSVKLLLDTIPDMIGKHPAVLVGDFNLDQNTKDYNLLASSKILQDTYSMTENKINEEQGTRTKYDPHFKALRRIDHIFIAKNEHPLKVHSWAILHDVFDGKLSSDHNPVMIEVSF